MYFGRLCHQPVGTRLDLEELLQRVVRLERVGLRQIGRQHVVERRDVGAALDAAMAAQRQDAAAGPADIAEQPLDDRRGADDLHAERVMRPADRVAERAGALAARSCASAPRRPRGTSPAGSR